MMPAEVSGALELRKALKEYSPNFAKDVQKEISGHLRSLTNRARGFVPSESPLSGWGNEVGDWQYRAFNSATIRRGITYSAAPSRPNKRGFRTLAAIYNKSAAGAIYETAGRKNPEGQPPAKRVTAYRNGQYLPAWESGKDISNSANPRAGKQFIDAMPPLVDSQRSNSPGRRTRKTKGRLLFRAWAEDNGRTTAAVMRAFNKANMRIVDIKEAGGGRLFKSRGA
jgi:hypothetical protein